MHPPLIHKSLIPHILEYQGEGGLRRIWTQYEAISRYVPVDDPGVWIDLDTRSEYESCVSRFAPV